MKKFTIFAVVIGLQLIWPIAPLHAAPTPDMFAYGMQIETASGNAFYELELPLEVYQAVTSKDLNDLRIFNAEGLIVPHEVYRPDNRIYQKDTVQAELPFFPITTPVNSSGDEVTIHIEKDEQGTIVDVKTGNGQPLADQKITSYLLDASRLQGKSISSLELLWSDQPIEFMGNIYVESSTDLTNWRKITTGTIARLSYGNYRLDRTTIPLPQAGKYLRLSWPKGQDTLTLTKVVARANMAYTVNQPDYHWTKAQVLPISDKPGHYKIDLGGLLPADKIKIRPKERNSMAGVILYSGLSGEKGNDEQWRGLIYNLDYQGTALYNAETNIKRTESRFWLLTVEQSETMINNPPDIEFGWQPHRLIFLAQGNGPFLLAYGSTNVPRPDFKVDPLLSKYRQGSGIIKPGLVTPGPQYVLAGPDRLLPVPPSLPWKKYILWATLLAGVLTIGAMSVTLYRQLQKSDLKSSSDDG
ncbi:MAG: DUF3999 domain-containing protein [Proteobacteria bacterium]|nr:DUF3999 domain-containing protein [Pseudomonadota bacterium]MBU1715349.1 DUF3999 domain-containing protein [Pseudomonadota bacterium]